VKLHFSAEVGGYPDTSFALNISPQALDFTPVKGKERTKMSAQIENAGKEKLKIEPVGYAENLFKIRIPDPDLKPGEKTKLMVKLNRRADLEKFEKCITFELDDKNKTRFTIPVKKMPVTEKKPLVKPPSGKTKGK